MRLMTEYVITQRRESFENDKKVFELLLTPSVLGSAAKRIILSGADWLTFMLGDTVGYETGKLWHKELPDHPVEVEEHW
ncbi:MAG: hypothetical protein JO065_04630 [Acidobacteria bacterium]|nr:hypothetical protein [Acidobacteriota bacterium]